MYIDQGGNLQDLACVCRSWCFPLVRLW